MHCGFKKNGDGNSKHKGFWEYQRYSFRELGKQNVRTMAANVMLIAVMVMAIVGVSYFLIEDKKNNMSTPEWELQGYRYQVIDEVALTMCQRTGKKFIQK